MCVSHSRECVTCKHEVWREGAQDTGALSSVSRESAASDDVTRSATLVRETRLVLVILMITL